jgi:hypothetical protein
MGFGFHNAPATFQALMNSILVDLIAQAEVAVYMDDILIYSCNLEHHHKIVCEVLKRLQEYNLYLKPEKCEFEKQEMEYLGMIIRPGEVQMDPGKVAAVKDWPTPTTLKEVRAFIGFANFYRRFIKGNGMQNSKKHLIGSRRSSVANLFLRFMIQNCPCKLKLMLQDLLLEAYCLRNKQMVSGIL